MGLFRNLEIWRFQIQTRLWGTDGYILKLGDLEISDSELGCGGLMGLFGDLEIPSGSWGADGYIRGGGW